MFGLPHDVQCTVALQLYLTLAVYTGFLRTANTVSQRVHRVLLSTDLNTFAIGNVDCSTTGVGQRHTCQSDGTFIRATETELTVCTCARQCVGYLVAINIRCVRLLDGNMSPTDGGINVLRHIACHSNGGGSTIITDADSVVLHLRIVDGH